MKRNKAAETSEADKLVIHFIYFISIFILLTRRKATEALIYRVDNKPDIALSIRQFLAENNIAVLEQPPYLPDLAPCDFFLFPKLKGVIKGTRFQDSKAITTAVTKELRAIPMESFQKCIEAWQQRLEKCIQAQGDYFEGDKL